MSPTNRQSSNRMGGRRFALLILACTAILYVVGELEFSPTVQTDSTRFRLGRLATISIADAQGPLDAFPEMSSGTIYVADHAQKRVGKVRWQAEGQVSWKPVDATDCVASYEPIEMIPMASRPYVLLLSCGNLHVLDKSTLDLQRKMSVDQEGWTSSIVLSPNERLLVTRTSRREGVVVQVFRTDDWTKVATWSANLSTMQFSPDGKHVASVFRRNPDPGARRATECGMTFFDLFSGRIDREWFHRIGDESCPGYVYAFLPNDSTRLLSDNFREGGVSEWDPINGRHLRRLEYEGRRHPRWLSVSHDGKLVAASLLWPRSSESPAYSMVIWDLASGKPVYQVPFEITDDPIQRARFSSEGNHILLVRSNRVELYTYELSE